MKKLLMAAGMLCGTAHAFTGNELYGLMQSKDTADQLASAAYVRGFIDASAMQSFLSTAKGGKETFCMPNGATVQQAHDIIQSALAARPADRHLQAGMLVFSALAKSWPCKN